MLIYVIHVEYSFRNYIRRDGHPVCLYHSSDYRIFDHINEIFVIEESSILF